MSRLIGGGSSWWRPGRPRACTRCPAAPAARRTRGSSRSRRGPGTPCVRALGQAGRPAGAAGRSSPASCAGSSACGPAVVPGNRANVAPGRPVPASASSPASAKASSIEVFAPWPWCGSMPCAASPRMTTRPRCQRSSGRTVNSAQEIGLATAPIISVTAGCQPRKAATASSARPRPPTGAWGQIGGALDDSEEVHGLAPAADRVVQQVRVRAHPELDGLRVGQGRQPRPPARCRGMRWCPSRPRPRRRSPSGAPWSARRQPRPRCRPRSTRPLANSRHMLSRCCTMLTSRCPDAAPAAPKCAAEDPLQVGAVDAEVGSAETLLVRRSWRTGWAAIRRPSRQSR